MSDPEVLKRKIQREREARKEAERLLEAKSRELFVANKKTAEIALFPELSPHPELRFDKNGRLVLANPAARTLLGLKEEVDDITLIELFPFTHIFNLEALIDENKVNVINQQIGSAHYQFVFNGVSKFDFINVYLSDITALELAKREIEKSHGETERLLSSISSILIGVNERGEVTRLNAAARELLTLIEGKTIGRHLDNSTINWSLSPLQEIVEELGEKDSLNLDDISYSRSDGKTGYLSIVVSKVLGGVDTVSGYLFIARDVTRRKELELQLVQAQKLESLGQLAAGIAHEINTPIQFISDNTRFLEVAFKRFDSVLNKSEELVNGFKEGGAVMELVMQVEETMKKAKIGYMRKEIPFAIEETIGGIDQVASIVSGMKQFSHPGSTEMQLTDINASISNTLTVARNEWKYVADIDNQLNDSIPKVLCHEMELNQVFLNIIINAAHAIESAQKDGDKGQGTITIKTSVVEDHVEVAISDTGTGIPEEAQGKIFDPFYTTKEVGKGTGQGLSIAYNVVVNKHGGSITFETQEGVGTTFHIRLPLTTVTQEEIMDELYTAS